MKPELRKPKGGPVSAHEAAGMRRLGEQLRRARLGRGWSQRGLERASGVDQTTISRLENGRLVNLGFLRIVALVAALEGTWQIFPPDPPDSPKPSALLPPPLPSDIAASTDW
jgi:transcriptional regulator with XRE-family HTH domain